MYGLEFENEPAVLAAVVANCGSLNTEEDHGSWWSVWDRLQEALAERHWARVRETAEEIVVEAVPEEGEIHPRRATHHLGQGVSWDDAFIIFTTPGEVEVIVRVGDTVGTLRAQVDFGRDSQHLAGLMLSALMYDQGLGATHKIGVALAPEGEMVQMELGRALAIVALQAAGDGFSAACVQDQFLEATGR